MINKNLKYFIKKIISKLCTINNTVQVGTKNLSTCIVWVEKTLKIIPKGFRILSAGAGEQQFKKFCLHLDYISQDFAKYNGKGNNKGLQTKNWNNKNIDIISDIIKIPEPDKSFDAIMCTEVFEHLSEPILALKEFSRLIMIEGYLIITTPFCSLISQSPYHFHTGHNRYFCETHLNKYGFKILEIKPNGNYFEYIAQEFRRIPSVSKKYVDNKPKICEKIALDFILRMLNKSLRKDKNSNELLNFGYHILA